jgi:hypothetical protein
MAPEIGERLVLFVVGAVLAGTPFRLAVSSASGSYVFAGVNGEGRTVATDPSRSFLIIRLRSVEMHNTVTNTDNDTVANYCANS